MQQPGGGASRIQPPRYRTRWLARRPPETLPAPRRAPSGPSPTPRYPAIPRWGLRQDFTPAPGARPGTAASLAEMFPTVLRGTAIVLALAALAEAFAYVLLMVNRAGPVSVYLALIADTSVFALGYLAVLTTIAAYVVAALWLRESRAEAYAALDTAEPRPAWQLWVYCVVPVVNLVAAPVLLLELVRAQDRARHHEPGMSGPRERDVRLEFIRRWWVAWVALTIVAVGCVLYSTASGGLQHSADATAYTGVTYLLGAAFLEGTLWLVRRIDHGPAGATKGERTRWLAA
ncbi:DUF4328 domain-containing protein [Tsukamurella sp. 1534]|uniref:DUF4328 domain-containing protein n=1 Tax=Tsukamurella sp. 1534 TaxID=1151061 RepID=UPI0002DBFECE|nr:DUF4328 domain-containing protein [Tsukamurella sp. 1534]